MIFELNIRIKYSHTLSENFNVLVTFHYNKSQRKEFIELESYNLTLETSSSLALSANYQAPHGQI